MPGFGLCPISDGDAVRVDIRDPAHRRTSAKRSCVYRASDYPDSIPHRRIGVGAGLKRVER